MELIVTDPLPLRQRMLAANLFSSTYVQSDPFGKVILLFLVALSILCWTLLVYKGYLVRQAFVSRKTFDHHLERVQKGFFKVSANQIGGEENPYVRLFLSIRKKTAEVLGKNQRNKEENQGEHPTLSASDVEFLYGCAEQRIGVEMSQIDSYLFVLAIIATLAPFTGLLGTVWGILISFSQLQHAAMGVREVMLGGLATALSTTVMGLLIAIPALVAHSWLKHLTHSLKEDFEQKAHHLLSTVEMRYRR